MEEKMIAVLNSIAAAEKAIASEIQAAAYKSDWNTVSTLTSTAKKLSEVKGVLSNELSKCIPPTNKNFVVEVTSGALANSYLSATPGMKTNMLKVGQHVMLVLGKKSEVATTVLKFGRFQDRKNVAKFYDEYQIKAGDFLRFTVDGSGKWHVEKI